MHVCPSTYLCGSFAPIRTCDGEGVVVDFAAQKYVVADSAWSTTLLLRYTVVYRLAGNLFRRFFWLPIWLRTLKIDMYIYFQYDRHDVFYKIHVWNAGQDLVLGVRPVFYHLPVKTQQTNLTLQIVI